MEKNNCSIVNDLIPLYVDGVCSEESKELVEKHLKECEECRNNLNYMKTEMKLPEEHQADAIRKIKRRIRIEKIVVSCTVAFVLLNIVFFGGLYFVTDQTVMNELIAEDEVWMEEDADGNVWLVRTGMAVNADYVMTDIYTVDGDVIFEFENKEDGMNEKPEDAKLVIKPVLCESRLSLLTHKLFSNMGSDMEERHIMFNANEKVDYGRVAFEYGDGEKVLWERK